jgi:hypothetical protein
VGRGGVRELGGKRASDLCVVFVLEQIFQNYEFSVAEVGNAKRVCGIDPDDARLRKVKNPVKDLLDRIGIGETLLDERKDPFAAIDIHQQRHKEPVFGVRNVFAAIYDPIDHISVIED